MSAVSTSRVKKGDPLAKKIPENPRYKHVRPTIDTGASITKYMEKIEEIRKNYRYKKDEIFKRMKVTTFVQLVIQVAEYDSHLPEDDNFRPDTADLEVQQIQRGEGDRSPAPSLALTEGDFGAPLSRAGGRSTLQGVIKGQGELDADQKTRLDPRKVMELGSPYLILDVRDKDAFDQCHIISAKNFPSAMLSRAVNYETKEMLAYKNQEGKIILLYDEDERLAPMCASTLVERGYDNIFLLSGGMKVAYKIFPEGLLTGTPPQTVTEKPATPGQTTRATKEAFDQTELENLNVYLDSALEDRSSGSRLSKASTTASRMSNYSKTERKIQSSIQEGRITGRAAFK